MDVEQLANTNQLGTLVQEYKQGNITMEIVMGLLLLGMGLIPFLLDRIIILMFSLWFGVVGGWMIYAAIVHRNNCQLLYEQGFIDIRRGKTQVIRYDRITAVWQRVTRDYRNRSHTGTTYYYRIEANDASQVMISSYQAVGERAQHEVTRRLMPNTIETYNAGGDVSFGPLTLNKQGLTSQKATLSWDEIKGVKVARGFIYVQKKDGGLFNRASLAVEVIPNLFIFLSLIDQICGVSR